MPEVSCADHSVSPPIVKIPRDYNAAYDLIERNLRAGRAEKIAYFDDAGSYSYGELADRVNRFASALTGLGVQMEQRVLLCLNDTIDFPVAFLGSIKAGIVPVASNTLLPMENYEHLLRDSRARALVVSAALLPKFSPLLARMPFLRHVIVSQGEETRHLSLAKLLAGASPVFECAPTTADDVCFWLYSSGSTGAPKGTLHAHSSLIQTAEHYARAVLGIEERDVVYSVAKLFFAYGLGNSLTFPLAVGATAVLTSSWAKPSDVFATLRRHRPTIFYGVPTLYAAMLASPDLPRRDEMRLRRCVSAGEALPQNVGQRWSEHFGVDILDGLGSTEMLQMYLSNRPGEVRYGSSGKAVPGYQIRIVDEHGTPVAPGEIGELQVCGPSSALGYWNNREKSRATFCGAWVRSGDKFALDADGYYVYAGRSDDMLKVSGIYVSPVEVESALISHDAVLEAAVVGCQDAEGLVKPAAMVVLKPGRAASDDLAEELKKHVKAKIAPYKYPRWVYFVEELPKTATGKIQRFKLRAQCAQSSAVSQQQPAVPLVSA
ncbi:MAG TPA: benzoate-CoA ligase family protein [Burkholderiaceae bacterium]|nr:benzoate-CoA ligase family protein [Burkholderiaceae bacterium]